MCDHVVVGPWRAHQPTSPALFLLDREFLLPFFFKINLKKKKTSSQFAFFRVGECTRRLFLKGLETWHVFVPNSNSGGSWLIFVSINKAAGAACSLHGFYDTADMA
jgi:hypothetical protein